MEVSQDIDKLKNTTSGSEKNELYLRIMNITDKDMETLYKEILNELAQNSQSDKMLNLLQVLLKEDNVSKLILSEVQKIDLAKSLINMMKNSQEEKDLIQCFSCMNEVVTIKLENDTLDELLCRTAQIISKRGISETLYSTICSYVQKIFMKYKDQLSDFMHIIPKLLFPPLTSNSAKNFCKKLMVLFKEKHELYVLKVWVNVLNALGKTLHKNLSIVTPFFQVIEKGFKSMNDEVCKTSFINWKCLISNFAMDDTVINDSKKLRFVLKPFRNLTKFSDSTSLVICDTWWHLAWNLTHNLSSRFTEVLIPMLEFTFKKATNGSHEKISVKGTALQVPLDVKVIVHHSKDIINMARIVIETFGNTKEMVGHIDCLLKSILYILSAVIEDENKESIEAVIAFINLVGNIIESRLCPPLTCLKCIDSLSKLPRSALISHCFHCGPRKPQKINDVYFDCRFLMAYNRLIQAGLSESLNPLLMTQKFINVIKHVTSQNIDAEILFEMWSGIASPLLETIEKTQEVNQGDRQEHDFSCLYDVFTLSI
ncbi:telomere-associated protein RIF1 [Caerostris extrusa]|uniref:Telomere-associated protein RIF1 n=1 Tax=Caerostris extrusa TaxID=172846 RepID=A0AAV4M9N8_CAEEX|nr:telomere-associated protein RIF1 [Caerostris extrusa]